MSRSTAAARRSRRGAALAVVLTVLAGACASSPGTEAAAPPAAPAGGAAAAGSEEEAASAEVDGSAVEEGGPTFDLEGRQITITSSEAAALLMGQYYLFDQLAAWGADVEIVTTSTTSGLQTLVAGRTDIASQGSDEVVLGAGSGADVVMIGAPTTRLGYVLVATPDIESAADLEGRTIAMSGPGGFDTLLSRYALEDAGVDPRDGAQFVQIGGSPERATALLAGTVDAAVILLDDWENLRLQTDELVLVQYLNELVDDFPAEAYFATRQYWEENPEVALAMACANLNANAWVNADRDRFIAYTLEHVETATEEATGAIYDAAQEIDMWPEDPDSLMSVDSLSGLVEAMVATGDLEEPVDPTTFADASYLEEAAGMGCGA